MEATDGTSLMNGCPFWAASTFEVWYCAVWTNMADLVELQKIDSLCTWHRAIDQTCLLAEESSDKLCQILVVASACSHSYYPGGVI